MDELSQLEPLSQQGLELLVALIGDFANPDGESVE